MRSQDTIYFLNVRIDNLTRDRALEEVKKFILSEKRHRRTRKVFFTNVHSIHLSRKDAELNRCINSADLVLPDGSGLKIAGKVLNKPVKENLNGTDFTPLVCEMARDIGLSVYLLGAKDSVVKKCRKNLMRRFPGLYIAGTHHGYLNKEIEKQVIYDINQKKPDILLAAMGSPLQEKWITINASKLDVGVSFAVGGLFDFLAEEVKRAPLWMRKLGIEWLHRFFQNPKDKWDRLFIEIPVFLALILAKKLIPSAAISENQTKSIIDES